MCCFICIHVAIKCFFSSSKTCWNQTADKRWSLLSACLSSAARYTFIREPSVKRGLRWWEGLVQTQKPDGAEQIGDSSRGAKGASSCFMYEGTVGDHWNPCWFILFSPSDWRYDFKFYFAAYETLERKFVAFGVLFVLVCIKLLAARFNFWFSLDMFTPMITKLNIY